MKKNNSEAAELPEGISLEAFQKVLHALAVSGNDTFQSAPAAHPLTSEQTLLYLAKHAYVMTSIGDNGPLNLLVERFKKNELSEKVILVLIDNKNVPERSFLQGGKLSLAAATKLIAKNDSLFHNDIAHSKNVPKEAIAKLTTVKNFNVVQTIAEYYPLFDEDLLDVILQRKDLDKKRIGSADETNRNWVYLALASNHEIVMPEKLQLRIIDDGKIFPKKYHLRRLAARKDLTQKVATILANSGKEIRSELLKNKSVSKVLKEKIKALA